MRKIGIGSVEILGYAGIAIWMAVLLLRMYPLSGNAAYRFCLGVLPNMGAAWCMTMFAKWGVLFVLKKEITIKRHLFICAGILTLAFGSEVVHDRMLGSPFDVYDMIITAAAQLTIFFIPILTKDKYFSGYTHAR